jgi:hypothetical protein
MATDYNIDDNIVVLGKKAKIKFLLGKENKDDKKELNWYEVEFEDKSRDHIIESDIKI